ncbi:MAG TPA: hypothetical protein VIF81_11870 [Pyrinomonadaceae bacterium]|jgi:hypothetical protein
MLYAQTEEKLRHAQHALNRAASENIVELCKRYLALLAEYRSQLYELANSGIRQRSASTSLTDDLAAARKSVRTAIENTTRERNRTEMLLLSITTVSGYEAVEMLNRQKYEGHTDWELRASGVKSTGSSDHDLMTIQEAVNIASLLRRDEHIAHNSA